MFFKQIIEEKLSESIINITPLSGGDINDVYKIITKQNTYVLKVNDKNTFPEMFKKEKLGLESISITGARAPKVIQTFTNFNNQFLILEYIDERSIANKFWRNFAVDLAKLHKMSSQMFGLKYNNYIGSLNQINTPKNSWETYFIENRISPLVKQAFDKNLLTNHHLKTFENLFGCLGEILPKEKPSLVHGDLWSGNLLRGKNQTPVFIDPAIYFGHREMDIAMTKMFGGFDNSFISFYNEIFPLEKNWEDRIKIHNLYPNLVHLILFGRTYLGGIESVINKF